MVDPRVRNLIGDVEGIIVMVDPNPDPLITNTQGIIVTQYQVFIFPTLFLANFVFMFGLPETELSSRTIDEFCVNYRTA